MYVQGHRQNWPLWTQGEYTVYVCAGAQTELAIVGAKVLNISQSIIYSIELATVLIHLSF